MKSSIMSDRSNFPPENIQKFSRRPLLKKTWKGKETNKYKRVVGGSMIAGTNQLQYNKTSFGGREHLYSRISPFQDCLESLEHPIKYIKVLLRSPSVWTGFFSIGNLVFLYIYSNIFCQMIRHFFVQWRSKWLGIVSYSTNVVTQLSFFPVHAIASV